MSKLSLLLILSCILSSCSIVDTKDNSVENQKYLETRLDTANMSEYDKQRYYNQNGLGVIKPTHQKRQ
jgi:uncharacterized protein YceK